jgi:hypothetical protein
MMPSKKKIKKILIILALLFVNAWFWGNAGLEYLIYRTFVLHHLTEEKGSEDFVNFALIPNLNYEPRKLNIPERGIEGEYLYFYRYKVKMPFIKNRENINIDHSLMERRLESISLYFSNESDKLVAAISLREFPDWIFKSKESLFWRFLEIVSLADSSKQESVEKVYYVRLSDLSWWNLIGNARIFPSLIRKSGLIGAGTAFNRHRYDVMTPHVRGFLTKTNRRTSDTFEFELDDRKFQIFIIARESQEYNIEDVISTIRPIEDVDKAYREMEARYKDNPDYPKELLILSMISLKGPRENYQREYVIKGLKEHLEWYKKTYANKKDKEDFEESIAEIQGDIEYFQKNMK